MESDIYTIVVSDETGQKAVRLDVAGETTWSEIGARAQADLHEHPAYSYAGEDELPLYSLHDEQTGEILLPHQIVEETIQTVNREFRARLAREMRAA
jgi:hypothetical protein